MTIEGNNLEQTVYREPIKVAGEHRFIAGSCVDCGHPLAEECIPSPVSVPTGPPRVTKQDRLFVPMCSSQFQRFVLQTKTWELRLRRRQWTSKFVRPGRMVELRCGYGRNNTALWGRIGLVVEASSIPELYETAPYHSRSASQHYGRGAATHNRRVFWPKRDRFLELPDKPHCV